MMWAAGLLAAMSTIIYPSISSLVSRNADADQQGGLHHDDVISQTNNSYKALTENQGGKVMYTSWGFPYTNLRDSNPI